MSKTQSKVRSLNKEVAYEQGLTISEVEQIIDSMWIATKEFIAQDPLNAIYLRNLGTFYGRESIMNHVNKAREKKE